MPKLINVSKKFSNVEVFNNFNLQIGEGITTAIMGNSGVGKTTLLNILAGICDCDGVVDVKRPVSYVFQTPRLIESLTVKQNLEYVMKNSRLSKDSLNNEIDEMLKLAQIFDKKHAYPNQLSGGQKQRVSLVRAFLFNSELMLLDEPFNSLDIGLKVRIINLYRDLLNKKPRTAVLVSHDIDECLLIADEIIVLGNNNVIYRQGLSKSNGLRDITDSECEQVRKEVYKALTQN
ncbi:MAG: ABC transporter ATP-binding protein [Clostridia bacterium]|nr:ABC transporter ATP-binding protein [Clostridia bacterium]